MSMRVPSAAIGDAIGPSSDAVRTGSDKLPSGGAGIDADEDALLVRFAAVGG